MFRGAIVGLGNVAVRGHLPGWLSRGDVQIVAATDAEPSRRLECAAHLPDAHWHDSAASLLDEPRLDFVDICTPPSSHAELVRGALSRRLHVLCEKPLVGTLDDLRGLVDLAGASGRVLHTVHNWHHAPIVRRARELVRDGAIGAIRHATWHTLRTQPAAVAVGAQNWRLDPLIAGGGILTDHGWHACYLLHRFIGSAPIAVAARLETRRHTSFAVEDTATLSIDFATARGDVILTWAADERRTWAALKGDEGAIELADDTLVLRRSGGEQRWSFPTGLSDGSQHPEWFFAVTEQFLAEITGRDAAGANLQEASSCVAVLATARESSRRGGDTLTLPRTAPGIEAHRELSR
jgi:predicted dehydrogenase